MIVCHLILFNNTNCEHNKLGDILIHFTSFTWGFPIEKRLLDFQFCEITLKGNIWSRQNPLNVIMKSHPSKIEIHRTIYSQQLILHQYYWFSICFLFFFFLDFEETNIDLFSPFFHSFRREIQNYPQVICKRSESKPNQTILILISSHLILIEEQISYCCSQFILFNAHICKM